MLNFDGTGPAGAGAFSGAGRGRGGCGFGGAMRGMGGLGFGGQMRGRRGQNRQQLAAQENLVPSGNQESGWLGRCIERLEQHIAVLQQRLSALKAQSTRLDNSAQN